MNKYAEEGRGRSGGMGFGREPPRGIPQQVKSPIEEFVREAAEARRPPPEYAPLAPLRELLEEAKERLGARGPGLATGMGCGIGVGAGVVGALGLGASDPALGGFRPVIGVGAGCGVGVGFGYGVGVGKSWEVDVRVKDKSERRGPFGLLPARKG